MNATRLIHCRIGQRLASIVVTATLVIATSISFAANAETTDIQREVVKRHDEAVKRLQDWIALPSIAAENRNSREGVEYMAQLARDAGFQKVEIIDTDGKPGVFATLDAGAAKTVGLYFMYDVKQFDPAEWSSPPLEARLVDKPGLGKAIVGRGAVNQKGPESAFLAALHAIRGAGKKMPVNLVMVAEGEEEIGSPHIAQLVLRPEVQAALAKTIGVFMPAASQDLDGGVTVSLGAKGVVELELVASGEKWGRGPTHDVHSSLKAMVDSPAWRLVKALDTLVSADGNTIAIDNYPVAPPISAEERAMIAAAVPARDEEKAKRQMGVKHWIDDLSWQAANERLVSQPTVNIEGLVAGYTGPGGKTVLPHRAVAKIDMRLVPGMKVDAAVAALKAHLARRNFGDIEVNVSGGYNATSTKADTRLIQAQVAVLKRAGLQPMLWPRNAGSYPGFVFTSAPLNLASGHFGLGNGAGAHAPDEYYLIESTNPKVRDYDGAVMSFVGYLYELAKLDVAEENAKSRGTTCVKKSGLRPRVATLPKTADRSPKRQDPELLRRLLRAKDRMDAASHEEWSVRRLARVSCVSAAHFARSFKDAFGVPPHRYLLTRRIERATALLRDTDLPITDIAFQTGWKSLGTFGRTFRDITGENPGDLRAQQKTTLHELERVPACFVSAAQRPNLTIAVSEKRRQDTQGIKGASEEEEDL